MTAIVYPASLPPPSRVPRRAAERRGLSTGPGPMQARAKSRDWLADHELEFVYTPAEMAIFKDWWQDTLQYGGAWFAAHDWPSADPSIGGVYQFKGGVRTAHRGLGNQRVQVVAQERGRGVDPIAPPLPGGFIGVVEGATDDGDGGASVAPPDGAVAGDALLLAVVRQVSTFDIGAGWSHIETGQDSSGGLRIELYGRIADGTSADTATYTVTDGPTMYVMAAFRTPADDHFPAGMEVYVDYNNNLAGSGVVNVGDVTKTTSAEQFALCIGFFESTYALGVGIELTGPPAGYTQVGNQTMGFSISGTPFFCQMLTGYRTFTGQFEDPDAFPTASDDVGGGGTGAALVVVTYE
jgi:hypothetical protein